MITKRFVATVHPAFGSPLYDLHGDRFYTIVFADDLAEAQRIASERTERVGEIWFGALVEVGLETDEHNIPRLDPVSWKWNDERIAELSRRIGRRA